MERHRRITINTSELTVIKKLQSLAEANCPQCGRRVEMVTPEQAVTLKGIHWRTIYGWVEGGQVHFLETVEGHLLICLDSLRGAQTNTVQQTLELASPSKPLLLPAEEGE